MKNTIKEVRTRRGYTQAQLAMALRVSRQTINAIETQRYTPSLPLAFALARFFGCTVEELFHEDHAARA